MSISTMRRRPAKALAKPSHLATSWPPLSAWGAAPDCRRRHHMTTCRCATAARLAAGPAIFLITAPAVPPHRASARPEASSAWRSQPPEPALNRARLIRPSFVRPDSNSFWRKFTGGRSASATFPQPTQISPSNCEPDHNTQSPTSGSLP
jgi:hypothetical protein